MSVRGSNAKLPTRTYSIALYSRTSNIRILQARKNKKRAPDRIWNLKFPVSGEFPHQKSVLFSIQCKSIKTTLRYGFGSVRSGYGLEYSADIPKLSVGFSSFTDWPGRRESGTSTHQKLHFRRTKVRSHEVVLQNVISRKVISTKNSRKFHDKKSENVFFFFLSWVEFRHGRAIGSGRTPPDETMWEYLRLWSVSFFPRLTRYQFFGKQLSGRFTFHEILFSAVRFPGRRYAISRTAFSK